MLKVETLEAAAREAGVQRYVLNADMDALAFSFITGWLACGACSWQHASRVYTLAP